MRVLPSSPGACPSIPPLKLVQDILVINFKKERKKISTNSTLSHVKLSRLEIYLPEVNKVHLY